MKSRFILVVHDITKDQENAITNSFSEAGLGYWHWFKDCWLVVDGSGVSTHGSIRDTVLRVAPNVNCLVFKIDSESAWSGFGEKTKFEWFNKTWKD